MGEAKVTGSDAVVESNLRGYVRPDGTRREDGGGDEGDPDARNTRQYTQVRGSNTHE
jgi:hypothetical protein